MHLIQIHMHIKRNSSDWSVVFLCAKQKQKKDKIHL